MVLLIAGKVCHFLKSKNPLTKDGTAMLPAIFDLSDGDVGYFI